MPGSGRPEFTNTLTEHWDGTSWSIIPSPDPTPDEDGVFGVTALSDGTVVAVGTQVNIDTSQFTPLILQNPESAPGAGGSGGSGSAGQAAPLFVAANDDHRWSWAGPSTVSKVTKLDTPLLQLNARAVDPVFAAGQPDPAWRWARDHSVAPHGPDDPLGQMDALDRLFTESI